MRHSFQNWTKLLPRDYNKRNCCTSSAQGGMTTAVIVELSCCRRCNVWYGHGTVVARLRCGCLTALRGSYRIYYKNSQLSGNSLVKSSKVCTLTSYSQFDQIYYCLMASYIPNIRKTHLNFKLSHLCNNSAPFTSGHSTSSSRSNFIASIKVKSL